MTDESAGAQMVPKCESVGAVGDTIIDVLRRRRGFVSLIDSIDDEILAELKGTVGLLAIRAYLETTSITPPSVVAELIDALKGATASLVAATSLLNRGGRKAAPSNKMFNQMMLDYQNSVETARAAIARTTGAAP